MGKRIGPHHRLVWLHDKARGLADHARGWHDLGGIHAHSQIEIILAGTDRHDNFFERTVASALAQTVDGALHLASPSNFHASQ